MAKLTHDQMFITIDQVTEFLEANLGREFLFKREQDKITLIAGKPRDFLDQLVHTGGSIPLDPNTLQVIG